MSDLTPYTKSGMQWLARNIVAITKAARMSGKLMRWGGTFIVDKAVPVGTAVVYNSRVFVATSDDQHATPAEDKKGWIMLIDLRSMRVTDAPWVGNAMALPPVDNSSIERVIASRVARHLVTRVYKKALGEPIAGVYRWRGIFKWKSDYSEGDIVAYKNAVYLAESGEGVPGSSNGWMFLHASGAVGAGPQFITGDNPYEPLTVPRQFRLTRTDSETGDIRATFVDAHIELDSLGSNSEYEK